ncbi:MAG: mannose-1-phosphate guanylyltransferase [Bacteroidota bacterium]|jgi:mannose-1-phosphate guanylyltransferase|nr:mannose-1-phosphate guanylyltransferase [Bacteroidota bacterium]
METHVVIMAGGIGSRLWPVSVPELPKQFIDLLGVGKSLLQMTVERFLPVCNLKNIWIVTSDRYVDLVRKQIPGLPDGHILAEPEPRSTAPCIAYACWKINREDPEANIIVTPADAVVLNEQKFSNVIRKALNFTAKNDCIVTIGIEPTRPETGYGYIHAEEYNLEEIVKVRSFEEKPDLFRAKSYLAAGNYFWNAGIFVWNVKTIVAQLKQHAPGIAAIMDRIAESFGTEEETITLQKLFPTCEKISIDYAVMEKADCIYVIASDFGWSDLGTFTSIKDFIPSSDKISASGQEAVESECSENKVIGRDVRLYRCEGCLIHAGDAKTVIVQGLSNYIVAVKNGNVLVCSLGDEQHIKEYSQKKP